MAKHGLFFDESSLYPWRNRQFGPFSGRTDDRSKFTFPVEISKKFLQIRPQHPKIYRKCLNFELKIFQNLNIFWILILDFKSLFDSAWGAESKSEGIFGKYLTVSEIFALKKS